MLVSTPIGELGHPPHVVVVPSGPGEPFVVEDELACCVEMPSLDEAPALVMDLDQRDEALVRVSRRTIRILARKANRSAIGGVGICHAVAAPELVRRRPAVRGEVLLFDHVARIVVPRRLALPALLARDRVVLLVEHRFFDGVAVTIELRAIDGPTLDNSHPMALP